MKNNIKIIRSWIPRRVMTGHIDFIPVQFSWRWLTKIERVTRNGRHSYYSLDYKEL